MASLTRGFVDLTAPGSSQLAPKLLVNDKVRAVTVLSTVLQHLQECDSFWLTVAFATKSGVMTLLSTLLELEQRQVRGQVLVSQYLNFTQPAALRALLQLSNITLRIATKGNFHAKGYLFQKPAGLYDLLIGSSNLTAGALKVNKEWNLQVSASEHGELLPLVRAEFETEFARAQVVDEAFLAHYEPIYQARTLASRQQALQQQQLFPTVAPEPNAMQREALANLQSLRAAGERKALLISATGTGKTYLSAFDALQLAPRRLLFVVHRLTIAQAALTTFERVFQGTRTMGLYSGNQLETTPDFLFCTIQTLSLAHHLQHFSPTEFDYLVIDETHRSGASGYQRILAHFQPRFLLGMTATPERTDGHDIYQHFDHNIAYEIRLQRALEEEMLCPFHYFGITDLMVDGQLVTETADFSFLVAEQRVSHILAQAQLYGCDEGRVRGLVFCRSIAESKALADAFNARGLRSVALTGESSDAQRQQAIDGLESDEPGTALDYVFTVDIFNEGIDIPRVNQVIMLRPTQSAIVFVQQLGRGLRKAPGKHYLTVLDFIGNYQNNYLVPIALFGDTSYNKDTLRKLLAGGSSLLPGTSTVNFDRIALDRIYASIDGARLNLYRDLAQEYRLLKFKLARAPWMMDFLAHSGRDPWLFVTTKRNNKPFGSYFNFAASIEPELAAALTPPQTKLLALICTYIANGKRIEEVELLELLLEHAVVSTAQVNKLLLATYGHQASAATWASCARNLNFDFVRDPQPVVIFDGGEFALHPAFALTVATPLFRAYLLDALHYARARYKANASAFVEGFFLYQKYSRRDVCRILNWELDETATVNGYKVKDGSCPLFVTYHKADDIAQSTNYEDGFLNNSEFQWMSRSRRKLESAEIQAIQQAPVTGLRMLLFIKKSDTEGLDFYYMGDVTPLDLTQSSMPVNGATVPVVKVHFKMNHPVEETMYRYLTTESLPD
ncbi:PLD-like domain-containing protein [Hymenobacter actinosclerus]|uniref:PLD-like domain-containing protein n=2 Tax=Hymenobacter actinosclerus TaxID=82805 RepID=A0A1I0INX8_9BACT|nr:PLD-like domain-containing protein [Hymenobacter actinosclerus]